MGGDGVWQDCQFVPEEIALVSIISLGARSLATVSEKRGAVRPASERSNPRPDAVLRDEQFGEWLNLIFASLVTKLTGRSVTPKRRFTPGGRPYWEFKSSGPERERVTTPTATAILEKERPSDGRFFKSPTGRWRKLTKSGIEGSMNWAQEMLVRAVAQHNPRLMPTPETCESFMGLPVGWTDPARKGTGSQLFLASARDLGALRPKASSERRSHAEETQVTIAPVPNVTKTPTKGKQGMKTQAIIKAEPDILSGSLQSIDDESLANEVKRRYDMIGKRLKELRPLFIELRKRFFNLPNGSSIMGCKTWTEFCEKHLKYSDRHVRRLIEGDNPATEKHRSKPRPNGGVTIGTARADSRASLLGNSAAARRSFAISHSPIDDSETWSKEEAVRQIFSWTLSCIKGFSLTEKRQIIEDVIAKLRDEMAFEKVDAGKTAIEPCSPAPIPESLAA